VFKAARALAREVEQLEAANAKLNEQLLTALGLGDLERECLDVLRPKLAAAERKLAEVRAWAKELAGTPDAPICNSLGPQILAILDAEPGKGER
jgi:hypothetical protein